MGIMETAFRVSRTHPPETCRTKGFDTNEGGVFGRGDYFSSRASTGAIGGVPELLWPLYHTINDGTLILSKKGSLPLRFPHAK